MALNCCYTSKNCIKHDLCAKIHICFARLSTLLYDIWVKTESCKTDQLEQSMSIVKVSYSRGICTILYFRLWTFNEITWQASRLERVIKNKFINQNICCGYSMRRLFWAPTTYGCTDRWENINNFTHPFFVKPWLKCGLFVNHNTATFSPYKM